MRANEKMALAAAFGRSWLSWFIDGTPRPISATFAVTNRCNLRCSYCNTPFMDPSELPLEKIDLLFDRLASFGVKRLGLAGGEPLVRKDIGDIIDSAKRRGFYVTMNTNLMLFERCRERLSDVDLFFTSLDGDRAAHESARGANSYNGVLEAIEEIAAEGRPVVAICVVTEHSIDSANHLLDVAKRVGFRVHFQPRCTDTEIVRGTSSPELTAERQHRLWQSLLTAKREGRPVASSEIYLETLTR